MTVILYGKDFEDAIKLKWKDHPGSFGWTINAITVVFIRQKLREIHTEKNYLRGRQKLGDLDAS